jgi:hypothetical protein
MRKRPIRGEIIRMADGTDVTILEEIEKDFFKVILPDGKLTAVPKGILDLPIIETKAYEKVA